MARTAPELDTAAAVLQFVRGRRADADAAEADLLKAAVDWAAMHSVDSIDDAACDWYGDQPIHIAGPGAPLVAEFSVAEFATAVGLSTEAGKAYVGEAIELRHRLPRLWQRVLDGDLPAWRARRIARATIALSREAAAHVDAKVAPFAHKIRPAALDRTIDTAIARFMPQEAEARQKAAADGRHFTIDTRDHTLKGLSGTASVYGTLDLADALDLESAVAQSAATLKDLGSQQSLDVRRAVAVGEIARRQLTLDLTGEEGTGHDGTDLDRLDRRTPESARTSPGSTAKPGREVVIYAHLSHAAVTGTDTGGADRVGHLDNLNLPVLEQQIRTWCGGAAKITVKPLIDLGTCAPVDRYTPPAAMADQVDLRDRHCVFPRCTRPAKRCDKDHVVPHDQDGVTCACNLAPLCRRHHRHKTHGRWRYLALTPGMFLWTSPYGYRYLVDHDGTTDVSPDRRTRSGHPPDH